MKILLIDYSTIAYRCFHSMKGILKTEKSEFVLFKEALASAAEYIKVRFDDYTPIVCVDSPSWRVQAWDRYYSSAVGKKTVSIDDRHWANKDGFWYTCQSFRTGFTDWVKIKSMDQKETLRKAQDHFLWDLGSYDERLKSHLKGLIGSYKGKRKDSDWEFATPKKTFKQWSLQLAPHFSDILDAGMVKVDECEADDLIAHGALNAPKGCEILIMSTDQDVTRSDTKGHGQLMDVASVIASWDQPIIGKVSTEIVVRNLEKKILLGDSGDGIGPCLFKDGSRVTESCVDDLIASDGFADVLELEAVTYFRNKALISLRMGSPFEQEMKDAFADCYNRDPVENNFLDILDSIKKLEIGNAARTKKVRK